MIRKKKSIPGNNSDKSVVKAFVLLRPSIEVGPSTLTSTVRQRGVTTNASTSAVNEALVGVAAAPSNV